jgi:hypothetical protein
MTSPSCAAARDGLVLSSQPWQRNESIDEHKSRITTRAKKMSIRAPPTTGIASQGPTMVHTSLFFKFPSAFLSFSVPHATPGALKY